MRVLVAMLFAVSAAVPAFADDVLHTRELVIPPFVIAGLEPANLDLFDLRAEREYERRAVPDFPRHTKFQVKRHIGGAAGFDNGNVHESIGLYLTVAEWGRWNFGVPAAELGVGRYRVWDRQRNQSTTKSGITVIVSLASVHYRMGYLRSFGTNWYLNIEQVYDLRDNMTGSQFGVSFSKK